MVLQYLFLMLPLVSKPFGPESLDPELTTKRPKAKSRSRVWIKETDHSMN